MPAIRPAPEAVPADAASAHATSASPSSSIDTAVAAMAVAYRGGGRRDLTVERVPAGLLARVPRRVAPLMRGPGAENSA